MSGNPAPPNPPASLPQATMRMKLQQQRQPPSAASSLPQPVKRVFHELPTRSSESLFKHSSPRSSAVSMSPEASSHRARGGAPLPVLHSRSSPTPSRPWGSGGGPASLTDARSIRSTPAASTVSPEDEVLSLKVRSLYDSGVGVGSDSGSQFSKRVSSIIEEGGGGGRRGSKVFRNSLVEKSEHSGDGVGGKAGTGPEKVESAPVPADPGGGPMVIQPVETSIGSGPQGLGIDITVLNRSEFLMAGGVEDWEDVNGGDVDRYGFINQTYAPSTLNLGLHSPNPPKRTSAFAPPKRISSVLHMHSTVPQKRAHHLRIKLSPFASLAAEMLRSPLPGVTAALHAKENSRAKKWREMAVIRKRSERGDEGGRGGGAEWGFVTVDAKLISRTWKGIPDCWRAAAWHAFLTASSKRRRIGRNDAELVMIYTDFIERPSADDVQIDLDVPRTINSHIMFRRRYRGGQRLLFRVLHSLSLYFPDIGYVQGMASLAATLLCYYDEETAFIMLVRMFELRGLGKLYEAGFGGLMHALEEFEGGWMKGGQVSRRLTKLGVGPTTYGTRWYLTLFNYTMPFPAQLRVWDVFMLLGDPDPGPTATVFGGGLDVLHATSAALIDGMKGILLRSDFEGSMKVLTSWIPVKDEELLMKMVKAEWKMRRRRRGATGL